MPVQPGGRWLLESGIWLMAKGRLVQIDPLRIEGPNATLVAS
jgi:hypothetical protein